MISRSGARRLAILADSAIGIASGVVTIYQTAVNGNLYAIGLAVFVAAALLLVASMFGKGRSAHYDRSYSADRPEDIGNGGIAISAGTNRDVYINSAVNIYGESPAPSHGEPDTSSSAKLPSDGTIQSYVGHIWGRTDRWMSIGNAEISFMVPEGAPQARYWCRFVKIGRDDVGPWAEPANIDIEMQTDSRDPNRVTVELVGVPVVPGFQFKCFARCDTDRELAELQSVLADGFVYTDRELNGRESIDAEGAGGEISLPLIARGSNQPEVLWFIVPGYRAVVTGDRDHPFLNNYYDKPMGGG